MLFGVDGEGIRVKRQEEAHRRETTRKQWGGGGDKINTGMQNRGIQMKWDKKKVKQKEGLKVER